MRDHNARKTGGIMRRFRSLVALLSVGFFASCDRGGSPHPFARAGRNQLTARGGLDLQSIEGGNVLRMAPAASLGCTDLGLSPDAVVATFGVAAAAFTNGDATSG